MSSALVSVHLCSRVDTERHENKKFNGWRCHLLTITALSKVPRNWRRSSLFFLYCLLPSNRLISGKTLLFDIWQQMTTCDCDDRMKGWLQMLTEENADSCALENMGGAQSQTYTALGMVCNWATVEPLATYIGMTDNIQAILNSGFTLVNYARFLPRGFKHQLNVDLAKCVLPAVSLNWTAQATITL